jgi:hypothetical protein
MNRQLAGNIYYKTLLRAMVRRVAIVAIGLARLALFVPCAHAAPPCCSITAINQQTGIATAKVDASGQVFEFKVTSSALLHSLKDGEPVYANFTSRQVSLDGKTICGTIVAIGPATSPQGPMAKPSAPPQPGTAPKPPSSPQPSATPQSAPASPTSASNSACCSIISTNVSTRLVEAKQGTSGPGFEFSVPKSIPIQNLHVGESVWANFNARKVSLDGKTACCDIVSLGKSAALAPSETPPADSQSGKPSVPATNGARLAMMKLPVLTIAAGDTKTVTMGSRLASALTRPRVEGRTIEGAIRGTPVTGHVVHLRGLDGIQQAQGLPDGVQELLMMHVKTLRAGESDHYMLNTDLASEWIKTHPVPDSVKQAARASDSHTGCNSFSMHCAGEAAQHAEGQAENLIQQAKADWDHAAGQLGHEWNVAVNEITACFADTPTNAAVIPIDFTLNLPHLVQANSGTIQSIKNGGLAGAAGLKSPSTPGTSSSSQGSAGSGISLGSGSSKTGETSFTENGSSSSSLSELWSASLGGSIDFGIPLLSSQGTSVSVDFFYIPCMPFVIRPRSITAAGNFAVEAALSGSLDLTSQVGAKYDRTISMFTGEQIPVAATLIVIPPSGPPIAELDISAFLEGTLEVSGKGQVGTSFTLDYQHDTSFDLACSGQGCQPKSLPQSQVTKIPLLPLPPSTAGAKINGQIQVAPKLFVGLELDADFDALQLRAGPEAALEGDVLGDACLAPPLPPSEALMAELDWKPALRADMLVAYKPVGNGYNHSFLGPEGHLIAFKDLVPGGSSSLIPSLTPPKQGLTPGSLAVYKLKMPLCYPYKDPVTYQVTWTGGGPPPNLCPPPAKNSPPGTCNLQPADPTKDLAITFVWPQAGQYSITVAALNDQHGREFTPPKPATLAVTVGAPQPFVPVPKP